MALTGLDVFKLLPKTNCGDCGTPTCLGFAMQVASGKSSYGLCPHLSDEAKARLMAASEPPIRQVSLGSGDAKAAAGGETVLFRHEKRFVNQPPVFVDIDDTGADERDGGGATRHAGVGECEPIEALATRVASFRYERVGQAYRAEGLVLRPSTTGQARKALDLAIRLGLIPFFEANLDTLQPLQDDLGKAGALVGPVEAEAQLVGASRLDRAGCAVVLRARGLDEMSALVQASGRRGVGRLVLEFDCASHYETLFCLIQARRLALKKAMRVFGHPLLARADARLEERHGDQVALQAAGLISHYAGVLVVPLLPAEAMLALLTWRHDLYSDPERPVQVEPTLRRTGDPGRNSPLYITTNYSLTFYSVENEVQASRIPSYVLPVDTGGTSVLTAWAAGKFGAEHVAEAIQTSGAGDMLDTKVAVIPGYVATMAPALQELTGWKVLVGPQEASGIPAFARKRFLRDG
ncbi:MAG: acetyl-CoA decarbonylase/synthase complex subunit gamma [Bacillota bacterium]|nr:acetyl-CoA decarbonylase/synthase complex subunit gamma [Bacillota bacterium]